jgi:hypothetical protein
MKFELGRETEPEHGLRFRREAWSLRTRDGKRCEDLKSAVQPCHRLVFFGSGRATMGEEHPPRAGVKLPQAEA